MKHYLTVYNHSSDSGEIDINVDIDIPAHKWNYQGRLLIYFLLKESLHTVTFCLSCSL